MPNASPIAYKDPRRPVPSDLEIAQEAPIEPIVSIAERAGLGVDDLEMYGKYKAKVHLDVREKFARERAERFVQDAVASLAALPESAAKATLRRLAGYVLDRRR